MAQFQLSAAEVNAIVQDWTEEWRVSIADGQQYAGEESRHDYPSKKKNGGQGEDPPPAENPQTSPINT